MLGMPANTLAMIQQMIQFRPLPVQMNWILLIRKSLNIDWNSPIFFSVEWYEQWLTISFVPIFATPAAIAFGGVPELHNED